MGTTPNKISAVEIDAVQLNAHYDMIKFMILTYGGLLQDMADMKRLMGIYKESYTERMLNVKEFMDMVDIGRTTFGLWKKAGLFRYEQNGVKGAISIPHSEGVRINELCKGISKNNRPAYLLNLQSQNLELC